MLKTLCLRLYQHSAVKFLAIGGGCALLQFFLLGLFIEALKFNATGASALAYLLSAGVNYILNYHFTFSSQQNHAATLPKFILVVAIGCSVNTAAFALFFVFLPWYLACQFLATAITTATNYLLHRFWIYAKDSPSP